MNDQATYFNQSTHRFPQAEILNPPPYQLLELQTLQTALALKPPAQLIDFGAGSGRITVHFLRQGFNVLAVDISTASLSALKKLYSHHKHSKWGKLTTATRLPDQPFAQGLVGADILHHVDLPSTLPLIKRALEPRAHLAFSEPNAWHLPWYLFLLKEHLPWSIEKNILHNNLPYLKKAFSSAGFTHTRILGHGLLPTQFAPTKWNLTLGHYLTPLAFRFLISATN